MLSIGSTVWAFGSGDKPTRHVVTSETAVSWVLESGQKVPKRHKEATLYVRGTFSGVYYCLTREAADAMFLERTRWKMSQAVTNCSDPRKLREIAQALGMPTGVV